MKNLKNELILIILDRKTLAVAAYLALIVSVHRQNFFLPSQTMYVVGWCLLASIFLMDLQLVMNEMISKNQLVKVICFSLGRIAFFVLYDVILQLGWRDNVTLTFLLQAVITLLYFGGYVWIEYYLRYLLSAVNRKVEEKEEFNSLVKILLDELPALIRWRFTFAYLLGINEAVIERRDRCFTMKISSSYSKKQKLILLVNIGLSIVLLGSLVFIAKFSGWVMDIILAVLMIFIVSVSAGIVYNVRKKNMAWNVEVYWQSSKF